MKRPLRPHRIALPIFILTLAFTTLAVAQSLSLDDAKTLREDVATAEHAIDRIGSSGNASAVREASDAIGRVSDRLDTFIEQADAKAAADAADIYDGGMKYPPSANVSIEPFNVPVGASEVHVPVTLDKPSPNTVIAHIRVYDAKGGRARPDKKRALIFRPGDPLTQTVSFDVSNMSEGNNVRCVQYEVPDGGNRKGGSIRITAKPGAVNEPITGGRDPLPFEPHGQLVYDETGQTIQFDDQGGPGSFSTALSHGRTQVGNGETGYYGEVKYNGFKRTDDGLILESRRLDEPVAIGSPATEYPFLAVMLSGHKTSDTHFKYGTVEWVAKMPNRNYSWPALWLLPTGGWPPEIDVYEGFGYNGSWNFPSDLSTNLHGGDKLVRSFTRPAMRMRMQDFGLPNTLDSEFHTFAVTVTPEWITMFVDGVETMQYANPFAGETWYPLTNVAVKAPVGHDYDKGSGAMTVRSLKVWKAE